MIRESFFRARNENQAEMIPMPIKTSPTGYINTDRADKDIPRAGASNTVEEPTIQ